MIKEVQAIDIDGFVFINETHTILPDQEATLDRRFGKGNWDFIFVPKEGWTWEQQLEEASHFVLTSLRKIKRDERPLVAVFLSPVPALLCLLSRIEGSDRTVEVQVFHNDNREAKELPGGRVVHVVAADGWILV